MRRNVFIATLANPTLDYLGSGIIVTVNHFFRQLSAEFTLGRTKSYAILRGTGTPLSRFRNGGGWESTSWKYNHRTT